MEMKDAIGCDDDLILHARSYRNHKSKKEDFIIVSAMINTFENEGFKQPMMKITTNSCSGDDSIEDDLAIRYFTAYEAVKIRNAIDEFIRTIGWKEGE